MTIAGGNDQDTRLDQLNSPRGISLDDENQIIYIADSDNHRIVEWRLDRNTTRIVAGGNGPGDELDQLNEPSDVIIDRQNDDLIIADRGNRRVIRRSRYSNSPAQIIIRKIDCDRLVMHKDGTLYVSDYTNNAVRRWQKGKRHKQIVVGGNGEGNQLNQLNNPASLFVDDDHTLYICDTNNHRVMKWMKDAEEGIVVAGGNGQGDQLKQLSWPHGVIVDQSGQIYVADFDNNRVMRWCEGEKEGTMVVDGNNYEEQGSQLNCPVSLSFDDEGNLYVVDLGNDRIEKFERDFD